MRTNHLLIGLFFGVLLSGCGGKGGSSSPPSAASAVATGVSILDAGLANPTNRDADVKKALTYFTYAKGHDEANVQARAGYALTGAAVAADALSSAFGQPLLSGGPSLPAKRALDRLTLWGGSTMQAPPLTTLDDVFPVRWAVSLGTVSASRGTNPTPAQVIVALENAQAPINSIISALSDTTLAGLETTPLTVTYLDSSGVKQTVKIGGFEGYCLRASARFARALIDLALAYDLDPGTFNFNGNALTQLTGGAGTLTPTQILPATPFATLNENGQALLSDFRGTSEAALTDLKSGAAIYTARAGSTGWLANQFQITDADIAELQTFTTQYDKYLTTSQPVTIPLADGTSISTTIDVNAYTTAAKGAPADLRTLMATLSSDGHTVSTVSGSIADPTLNGLFPKGLPDSALYGRSQPVNSGGSFSFAQAESLSGIFFNLGAQ